MSPIGEGPGRKQDGSPHREPHKVPAEHPGHPDFHPRQPQPEIVPNRTQPEVTLPQRHSTK